MSRRRIETTGDAFATKGGIYRASIGIPILLLGFAVPPVWAFVELVHHALWSPVDVVWLAMFVLLALRVAIAKRLEGSLERGLVKVSNRTLSIGSTPVVKGEDVDEAILGYRGFLACVALRTKGGKRFHIATPSAAEAAHLVRVLGIHPRRRPIELSADSPLLTWLDLQSPGGKVVGWVALTLLVVTLLKVDSAVVTSRVLAIAAAIVLALSSARTKLSIGSDAVKTSWLGRGRRIESSRIDRVEKVKHPRGRSRVRVVPHEGAELLLTVATEDEATTLAKELEAIRPKGALLDAESARDALRPREKTTEAWLVGLRRIGRRVGDHRAAPIEKEKLIHIAEDARAPLSERAAAYIALREEGTEAELGRVTASLGRVVDPRDQQALKAVIDAEDDTQCIAALDQLR